MDSKEYENKNGQDIAGTNIAGTEIDETKIDELIKMIDGKMDDGVNRLSVGFTQLQNEGDVKEKRSMGKSDSWYPWVWGEGFSQAQREE